MDLERDYGLTLDALEPHAGGFASDCWVADGRWFVKVWPEGEQPVGLRQLGDLRALGLPVVEPLRARDGELYARTGTRVYAVFPYLEGRTATWEDWRVAARALRRVHDAPVRVDLPPVDTTEPAIRDLAQRVDHPWIADRAAEVTAAIARLDDVRSRLAGKPVPQVICHTDFHGLNLLVDDRGDVAAILDWDFAVIGPREFDLWVAADGGDRLVDFLEAYGADDLELDHLEFALLARGLRDLSARVMNEIDRPGVETWGFDRIRSVDRNLEIFRPYCRT
ncbi:phosphotransferase enzyme family protein [Microlunatus sp. GCM10028923]|uniref:phosphotransferase enzyme family protein n=1 Tax=Microlunatus sp. GCM10028923 TaxID=3273400 RepID=UPI00360803FF